MSYLTVHLLLNKCYSGYRTGTVDIWNVLLFVLNGRAYCFMLGLRLMKKCLLSFPSPVDYVVGVGGLRKL